MSSFDFDEGILAFATDRQRELILAWREHGGKGYRSRRDMNCIVFHAHYGEIQRIKCDITRLAESSPE